MVDQGKIDAFRGELRGEVIEPQDARYDEARALYNGMIDKRPRVIARCVDVADVMTQTESIRCASIVCSIVQTTSGFPQKSTRFLDGMPLDPPRAGMTAAI